MVRTPSLRGMLFAVMAVGSYSLMSGEAAAKKPPKGGDCPNCPATIEINGLVCTLEACSSFDCVYVCPFPF